MLQNQKPTFVSYRNEANSVIESSDEKNNPKKSITDFNITSVVNVDPPKNIIKSSAMTTMNNLKYNENETQQQSEKDDSDTESVHSYSYYKDEVSYRKLGKAQTFQMKTRQ